MDRKDKENLVAGLRERLARAQGSFIVDYQGVNVETSNQMRRELRKAEAEFQVVKNRLLKLASAGTSTEVIQGQMRGPSAVALAYGDVVSSAKALVGLADKFKALKIKGGQIGGRVLDAGEVRRLSELPGREILLSQTLGALQAVPTSFVRVLNAAIAQLLYALKAIENQKTAM